MSSVRMFLAGSLADHKVDATGHPAEGGISDRMIQEWFQAELGRLAGDRLEILTTQDPLNRFISEDVKHQINCADYMLCLFTKRSRDGLLNTWTTSPYVLSESGYGECHFRQFSGQRIYAFVEDGVDRDQLGLAFAGDRALPTFRRDDLATCTGALEGIVDDILHSHHNPPPYEPLLMRKVVTVWRSGWVLVETLFRHRLWKPEEAELHIPHAVWRVSRKLPELKQMLDNRVSPHFPSTRVQPFLRCLVRRCGKTPGSKIKWKIVGTGRSKPGNEVSFDLVFRGLKAERGDDLEYSLIWAYPGAFQDPARLPNGHSNSVGMRTGQRGPIANATLVLKFERDWTDDNAPRTIEENPHCFINTTTSIPATQPPVQYWHDRGNWNDEGEMLPAEDAADGVFDVFSWQREKFQGQLKVTWQPAGTYHPSSRTRRKQPVRVGAASNTARTRRPR